MQVTLYIQNGALAGRAVEVRSGQTVQVGRTEWADMAITDDPQMADVHFAVACGTDVCRIHNLSGEVGLLVNDEQVEEVDLGHGNQIVAGATTFLVQIENAASVEEAEPTNADPEGAAAERGESGFAKVAEPYAATVCEKCELDEAALALLTDEMNPLAFVQLLSEKELYIDAIMFLARALPKQEAIWWACVSLEKVPQDATTTAAAWAADQNALDAARKWVREPTEENRREAEQAAEATGLATSAGIVAQGVFWSGGSISLPDLPEVLPPDHLTGQAVAASLKMASAVDEPDECTLLHQGFLAQGIEVASGELGWEDEDSKNS